MHKSVSADARYAHAITAIATSTATGTRETYGMSNGVSASASARQSHRDVVASGYWAGCSVQPRS